jgi:hypothetical protein
MPSPPQQQVTETNSDKKSDDLLNTLHPFSILQCLLKLFLCLQHIHWFELVYKGQ